MVKTSSALGISLIAGLILLAALGPLSAQEEKPAKPSARPPAPEPATGSNTPLQDGGGRGGKAGFRPLDGIAARVNGDVITWNDVREKMGNVAKTLGYPSAAERERKLAEYALSKLKTLVQDELVLQMAKLEGIEASKEDVDREMRRQQQGMGGPLSMLKLASDRGMTLSELRTTFEEDILRQKFLMSKFLNTPWARHLRRYNLQVSPGEIREFYRLHQGEFKVRGTVWLRRLHLSAEEQGGQEEARALGQAVIKDLKGGLTPAEVDIKHKLGCHQFSCPIADLEPIYQESGFKKSIKKWAFSQDVGAVSELFELGPGNYAIFYLEKKTDENIQSFEEVQDAIRNQLRLANQQRAQDLMLRELFKDADIEPVDLKRFMLNPNPKQFPPGVVPRDIVAGILGKSF